MKRMTCCYLHNCIEGRSKINAQIWLPFDVFDGGVWIHGFMYYCHIINKKM